MSEAIYAVLEQLKDLIQTSFWLAPLVAFIAGVLTSITPCALSSIPLVIGYVGGTGVAKQNPKRAFTLSLVFALGTAVTFTVLGTIASLAGNLIGITSRWWYLFLGILMVVLALQTWEVINIIPSTNLLSKNKLRGYAGSLAAGILAGIFSSPCATPVLIALLSIVASKGSLAWGIMLLLFYSIGHGVLSVIAGTSVGLVQKITSSSKYGVFSAIVKIVMGLIILGIGLYMIYLFL